MASKRRADETGDASIHKRLKSQESLTKQVEKLKERISVLENRKVSVDLDLIRIAAESLLENPRRHKRWLAVLQNEVPVPDDWPPNLTERQRGPIIILISDLNDLCAELLTAFSALAEQPEPVMDAPARIAEWPSVSTAANPSDFANLNIDENGQHTILNMRPPSATGPPITLFHPVFAEFLQNFKDTKPASPQILKMIPKFAAAAGGIYGSENARRDTLGPLFGDLTGTTATVLKEVTVPGGQIDAAVVSDGCLLWVEEWKNELCSTNSDATMQAAICYSKFWGHSVRGGIRSRCCCPTILITLVGPWICVHGAILLDEFVCQPLTEFMYCMDRPGEFGDGLMRLARLMQALSIAHTSLRDFYRRVTGTDKPVYQPKSPYQNTYGTETHHLTYKGTVRGHQNVWRATCKTRGEVIVKFVKGYGEDAHRLLADRKMAPKLYHIGAADALGCRMVVMEYIEPKSFDTLSADEEENFVLTVRQAIQVLHSSDKNLVFGDLRPPNTLVPADGRSPALLIDFDWSGKEGSVRYPVGLVEAHQWPEGAVAGAEITKAHDLEWLGKLPDALQRYKASLRDRS